VTGTTRQVWREQTYEGKLEEVVVREKEKRGKEQTSSVRRTMDEAERMKTYSRRAQTIQTSEKKPSVEPGEKMPERRGRSLGR